MTFDQWWDNLPDHLPLGTKAQMKLAWDAAKSDGALLKRAAVISGPPDKEALKRGAEVLASLKEPPTLTRSEKPPTLIPNEHIPGPHPRSIREFVVAETAKADAYEDAARSVEKISEDYYHEYGSYDPSTNAWEIGHRHMEYVEALDAAVEAIRKRKAEKCQVTQAIPQSSAKDDARSGVSHTGGETQVVPSATVTPSASGLTICREDVKCIADELHAFANMRPDACGAAVRIASHLDKWLRDHPESGYVGERQG